MWRIWPLIGNDPVNNFPLKRVTIVGCPLRTFKYYSLVPTTKFYCHYEPQNSISFETYVMQLSVSSPYTAGWWITNWKGFVRRRQWRNRAKIPAFACRDWGKHGQDSLCPGRVANRTPLEYKSRSSPLEQPSPSKIVSHCRSPTESNLNREILWCL
jgi:hypothetical protein